MTRYLFLSDSYVLVSVGRFLWREDGSVFCMCCWPLPTQSFSGPSPLGLAAVIYCLRFEASVSSPPTTRRVTVEVFDPASTRVTFKRPSSSLYNPSARTKQKTQPLYLWENLFSTPLPSIAHPTVACVVFRGTKLWQYRSRLMRLPCSICVHSPTPINFQIPEPTNQAMALEPISKAYFINSSHQPVSYVYPPIVTNQKLGKHVPSATNTTNNRRTVGSVSVLWREILWICLCFALSLLGNGAANTLPRQQRIVADIVFWSVHVVSKENGRLVLPKIYCDVLRHWTHTLRIISWFIYILTLTII
jgi:hypothetical protein